MAGRPIGDGSSGALWASAWAVSSRKPRALVMTPHCAAFQLCSSCSDSEMDAMMQQLPNDGDQRNQGFCVHCGGPEETRDHTPSKAFLDRPLPENLPVAPACFACNNGFAADEEYVACLLECGRVPAEVAGHLREFLGRTGKSATKSHAGGKRLARNRCRLLPRARTGRSRGSTWCATVGGRRGPGEPPLCPHPQRGALLGTRPPGPPRSLAVMVRASTPMRWCPARGGPVVQDLERGSSEAQAKDRRTCLHLRSRRHPRRGDPDA